jgi:hypothetical protein
MKKSIFRQLFNMFIKNYQIICLFIIIILKKSKELVKISYLQMKKMFQNSSFILLDLLILIILF